MDRAKYNFDDNEQCGIICFENRTILIDIHDMFNIINHSKMFIHIDSTMRFPYFISNKQNISYLEFIFGYQSEDVDYLFINGNKNDIRRANIDIYHYYHKKITNEYDVIKYQKGHICKNGKDANKMKNPIWYTKNSVGEIYILMYCERDTIVQLCEKSYEKIKEYEHRVGKKITFSKHKNGYIQSTIKLFIHQIIMDCYGNGKGTSNISVDHIDRNPLNNCYDNLRIVDTNTQQQNTKGIIKGTKRARKKSARELPEGLTQEMLEKYVVYYRECYNIDKQLYREFFKVERHPKLEKIWTSSKSNKISILGKLESANKIVRDLEEDIYPDHSNKKEKENDITHSLPKYVSLRTIREKPCLVFEKRITKEDGTKERFSLKHSFLNYPKNNEQLKEPLDILINKVKEKYNIQL